MNAWTFNALWHLVASTFSLATLIGFGAAAVAVLTPPMIAKFIPNLRVVAICLAASAFAYSTVAARFYHDALVVKQNEWDRAKAAEAEDGERARTAAERDVADDTPDVVRRDTRNRDNWK